MSEALPPIVCSIAIDAPVDHVWRVLTAPEEVSHWLGCLRYTGEPGSTFYMQPDAARRAADDLAGATHCDVESLEAPHRFTFSWYMPGTPKTFVHFLLESNGEGTDVTLRHEGWDQFPPEMVAPIRDMLAGGWSGFVLPSLRDRASESFARPPA